MKKIIGWFKNILMRILEVVNYMIKKDNEIELAKLEIRKEITESVLTDRKIQIVLAGATVGMSIGLGIGMAVSLAYIHFHNLNIPQNILAN